MNTKFEINIFVILILSSNFLIFFSLLSFISKESEKINELFSMVDRESVRKVIAWFNKTYDKKLTPDDYEWMVNSDTFYAGDDDDN